MRDLLSFAIDQTEIGRCCGVLLCATVLALGCSFHQLTWRAEQAKAGAKGEPGKVPRSVLAGKVQTLGLAGASRAGRPNGNHAGQGLAVVPSRFPSPGSVGTWEGTAEVLAVDVLAPREQ